VDDLFAQDRRETLRLCALLKAYQESIGKRLKFCVQVRLDRAKDQELLKAMKDAGVYAVAIGLESPIEEELAAMNKRLNPEKMLELIKIFRRSGFLVHGMFIFGYPMKEGCAFELTSGKRLRRYKKFIRKARLDTIQVMLPIPLPGSQLRERLAAENRVYPLKDLGWQYYDGSFPLFEMDSPLTPEEAQQAIRKIMGRFYNMRYLLMFLLNIVSFPQLIFHLTHLRPGWRRWHRKWRNYFLRFSGSKTVKKWSARLRKSPFLDELKRAKMRMK
jgi:radical SAM superfamily enzyme YgiQ (UPF0313 family)